MIAHMVLAGFAGWRLGSLLVFEDGPWGVFHWIRSKAGATKVRDHPGFWAELLQCIMCTTVWSSAAMFALWYVSEDAVALVAACSVALAADAFIRGRR